MRLVTAQRLAMSTITSLGLGCSMEVAGDEDESIDLMDESIIDGTVDYGHPAVGIILTNSTGCTGSLIGRRTVLTAAHCVNEGAPATFCAVLNGIQKCMTGTAYRNPSWHPFLYGHAPYDEAVVKLNGDFTATYGVVPVRISSTTPPIGGVVTLVGFGCTEWGTATGWGTKRTGTNQIDGVAPSYFSFNEDSSHGSAMGCQGDSGGPIFKYATDCTWGTFSARNTEWGLVSTSATRVDDNRSWIVSKANDPTIYSCGQSVCGDGICHPGESYCIDCGATSAPLSVVALAASFSTPGRVYSSDGKINCASGSLTGCNATYPMNSVVTLTAQPTSSKSRFLGWSGACSGTGACTVTIKNSTGVTARFGCAVLGPLCP